MTALLEASDVSNALDGFRAIDNLSFTVNDRKLRAVIGPDGACKTTFMDLVTGRTRPDSGTILLGEVSRSLSGMSEARIARAGMRRRFQKPTFFDAQTVAGIQILALRSARGPLAVLVRRARHRGGRPARRPSGPTGPPCLRSEPCPEAWLEIGMPLAQEPRVLPIDEPAAGMTATEREKTTAMPVEAARSRAVVAIELDMEFLCRLGCRVTVLHEGRVLAEGSLDRVRAGHGVVSNWLWREA